MRALARLIAPAVLLPFVAVTVGCGSMQRETHPVRLHIETDPKGAWISRVDDKGKNAVGQAPVDVELTRWSERWEGGSGMWITTGILGATTAGLGVLAASSDDSATRGISAAFSLTAGICFLIALPLAIVMATQDGNIMTQGYVGSAPTFEASMPGYSGASIVLSPNEEPPEGPLVLRLAPAGSDGNVLAGGKSSVFGALGGGGLGLRGTSEKAATRPVMAVFALEDRSKGLGSSTVEQLTDYIAARITEAGRFRVVPRSELRARISETKADSYAACVDESCQIELGKAVAAQKSLATRLIRAGTSCAMTMTLYDLVTEASETAATVRTACSEQALMDGIDQLTTKLAP